MDGNFEALYSLLFTTQTLERCNCFHFRLSINSNFLITRWRTAGRIIFVSRRQGGFGSVFLFILSLLLAHNTHKKRAIHITNTQGEKKTVPTLLPAPRRRVERPWARNHPSPLALGGTCLEIHPWKADALSARGVIKLDAQPFKIFAPWP